MIRLGPMKFSKGKTIRGLLLVLLIITASLFAILVLAATRTPMLIKDINPTTSSTPKNLIAMNGIIYFSADDGSHGEELWRSDATLTGTFQLRDIYTGLIGSNPGSYQVAGGELFFKAGDGNFGEELWKTDGTYSGTVLVMDISTGTTGSSPAKLTNMGDIIYFTADVPQFGRELWRSDGTISGTYLLKDINKGLGSSALSQLTVVGNQLFFAADDGTTGGELWLSDGTVTGTNLLKNINSTGDADLNHLLAAGSTLFFTADDGITGAELWQSDGTVTGTVLVRDIITGSTSSGPNKLTRLGESVVFRARDLALGEELWISDGTFTGTKIVRDINPGFASAIPTALFNFEDIIYFSAISGNTGRELWRSDGTLSGTRLLIDLNPGSASAFPIPRAGVNSTLFFQANDGIHGNELWKTNGPLSSTLLVGDLNSMGDSTPNYLSTLPNSLIFSAYGDTIGRELWGFDLLNQAPSAAAGGSYTGTEGTAVSLAGFVSDPDDDILHIEWESSSQFCSFSDRHSLNSTLICADNGEFSISLNAYDWWYLSTSSTVTASIQNLSPTLGFFNASPATPRVYETVSISILYEDPGQLDTHSAMVDWGDSSTDSATVNPISRTLSATHVYSSPGEYTVTVTLEDDDGGEVIGAFPLAINWAVFLPNIRR